MKTRSHTIQLCVLLAGFLTSTPGTGAALVVGNLTSVPGNGVALVSTTARIAVPFSLGATFMPAELASITLRLRSIGEPTTASLALWSDSATLPGIPLVDLGTIDMPFGPEGNFTFTPLTSFTLQPDTNYWVVLSMNTVFGTIAWRGTQSGHAIDPGSDPAANIPPLIDAESSNSGATWFHNTRESLFAVNSVPEPATLSMLALGALFVTCRRRLSKSVTLESVEQTQSPSSDEL